MFSLAAECQIMVKLRKNGIEMILVSKKHNFLHNNISKIHLNLLWGKIFMNKYIMKNIIFLMRCVISTKPLI